MVETSFGELLRALESDIELPHLIAPAQRRRAIEHVLLYLHRQEILTLNHGMTVMRRAMTIEVAKDDKRKTFLKEDYLRLDEHYREKRIQVHVMREYAEVALQEMAEALRLVLDYFTDSKQSFVKRYFSGREDVLKLATSEESWKSIIGSLNTTQKLIVADDDDINRLVLAGPGSGKTRVIVHRIAYLLRVRRVPASSIVALTFNRHAANEIRKRLLALVGTDAYGVSVLTYHSMAMRLTGTRFGKGATVDEQILKCVLSDAVELLEGKRNVEGEDDLCEQLLRGYRYILVDEYQDIDDLQYRLVSALAGRHMDEDGQLCIMAVGDDDQNIYAWRDTNNRYIEQFREKYGASISFLVDNYRSSSRIIEAANCIIEQNPGRLKEAHPIRIDKARQELPVGGVWEELDEQRGGRVLRLLIDPSDREQGNVQAQAAMAELGRLLAIEHGDWNGCAILGHNHRSWATTTVICGRFRPGASSTIFPISWQPTKTVHCPSPASAVLSGPSNICAGSQAPCVPLRLGSVYRVATCCRKPSGRSFSRRPWSRCRENWGIANWVVLRWSIGCTTMLASYANSPEKASILGLCIRPRGLSFVMSCCWTVAGLLSPSPFRMSAASTMWV